MTDRELLEAYAQGSQGAFAELVDRHAGHVHATCLRLLGNAHAAEDVAQATFLVLARKARGLSGSTVLAGWLHTVAREIALNLLREETRRRRREKEAAMVGATRTSSKDAVPETIRAHLDAALATLSGGQREVLLLRHYYGRTEVEAAAELGWSRSRVSVTLSRALEALRADLARRGLAVPAAALGGMLAAEAGPAVPAALVTVLKGIGTGTAAASISGTAASLAEGAMRTMLIAKLKLAAAVVGTTLVVGGGGGVLAVKLGAAEPSAVQVTERNAPKAAELPPEVKALPANQWVRLEKANSGGSWHNGPAVFYDSQQKRFVLVGGQMTYAGYQKGAAAHPYQDLALDLAAGQWENLLPPGKNWGPKFGDCKAPGFKSPYWSLADAEGTVRPNTSSADGISWYQHYAYSPDTQCAYFYVNGSTLSYDPGAHVWKDLAPANYPAKAGGRLLWGSMCYLRHAKKILLFGGANIQTERGDPGTWTYDPATNAWEELKFSSAVLDGPGAKCAGAIPVAQALVQQVRTCYYRAEPLAGGVAKLDEAIAKLAADIAALGAGIEAAKAKANAHEKQQLAWAAAEVDQAKGALDRLKALAGAPATVEAVRLMARVHEALGAAGDHLALQPPARANPGLVYDPVNQKAVLFGGDQLGQLVADTWTFDGQRWEEKRPELSPSPRGCGLLWLPGARKVLLLGGYGYASGTGWYPGLYAAKPAEAWTYDAAANKWEFLRSWDGKSAPPMGGVAAGEGDVLATVTGSDDHQSTWVCRIEAGVADAAGTARLGVKPGAIERRTGCYDPDWYLKAPPGDTAKEAGELKALPANTWTLRRPPNRPEMVAGWGRAVYSPELDMIIHFAGGHCYYDGTAPQVYDVKANRWSIPYAPQMMLEFCTTNGWRPSGRSLGGNPWMTCHTWGGTGYDPTLRSLIHWGSSFFNPEKGAWRWSPPTSKLPWASSMKFCTGPTGAVAWSNGGLWQLDPQSLTWRQLPLKGTLPEAGYDDNGICYDSKRDRLLLFSFLGPTKGQVIAYDLKTGEAKPLGATGSGASRETAYLPELDMVLLATRTTAPDGKLRWLVYDCAKNAWFAALLPGSDPMSCDEPNMKDRTTDANLGLMYDPNRKLCWVVDSWNQVYALKFDPATADLKELK